MPVEIEAKMRVPDLDAVRAALRDRGANRVGLVAETNTFFDTPDHALRAADRGLRLRTNRDADTGRATHVITHKGPLQPGAVKVREETELAVDDPAAAARLLAALGFEPTLTFPKHRESWELGGCKVELDDVPGLGTFVEVEGPGEAAVMRAREAIGLADSPVIKESYIALLTAAGH